jgi:outer membrane lipoprotein-sorting protein
MIRTVRLVCLLCLLLPVHARADASVLDDLQCLAGAIRTISSSFTQEKHLALFDEVMVSKGDFAFQRPSSLRWEYTEPFRSGFLLKDGAGKEWDEASGTVRPFTVASSPTMSMVAEQIMAWTTFDIPWLQSRYEITQCGAAPVVLELRPKSETAREFLERIVVTFSADRTTVSELELHETDGDYTVIRFTGVRINAALPQTIFTSVR